MAGIGYNGGMTRLNETTLPLLSRNVAVPQYDRKAVMPGIVHIGVGGFHRAHEAVYLDDLMAAGAGQEWGICGAGLRPADKAMRDALVPQDCLYTVETWSAEGHSARIIGSLVKYLFAPEEGGAVLDTLASPLTRDRLPHHYGRRLQFQRKHGRVQRRSPRHSARFGRPKTSHQRLRLSRRSAGSASDGWDCSIYRAVL